MRCAHVSTISYSIWGRSAQTVSSEATFSHGAPRRKISICISSPSTLFPSRPPQQSRSPLQICASLPDFRKIVDTPVSVLRHLVAERLADFDRCLEVFADESVYPSSGTSTAGFYIPNFGLDHARRLNFMMSLTTAELAATRMVLHHHVLHHLVIFTNSSCALKMLLNDEHNSPFVREVANACRSLEDSGCSLSP